MSSSATTEPLDPADPPDPVGPPRRLPVMLGVAAVLALLLVVAGILALLGTSKGAPTNNLVGVRLNATTFPREPLVGAHGSLGAPWVHHGGAVLLFFANWCPPCRAEMRHLGPILGKGDVGGVQIVGYDGDASSSVAASFVTSNHVAFPVAHDGGLIVSSALVPAKFPAAVFIGPTGRITAIDYGALSEMQLSAGLSTIKR
jgi:thiol-disulfide isomerase/thioredoxin